MKKLLLIIPIALYLFMVAYSMSDGKTDNALGDLAKLEQLERSASFVKLNSTGTELLTVLEEQKKLIRAMEDHIYNGSLNFNDIDSKNVSELINYKPNYEEKDALFRSKAYKAYYEVRTRRILAEYDKTGVLDINNVVSDNSKVFDSFITDLEKSAPRSRELTLLLQNKLMDRLVYDNIPDKGKYFYEILSLRKQDKENNLKRREYLYQLFESRARLDILKYIVVKNSQAIYDKTKFIGVKLYSKNEYKLTGSTGTVEFFRFQEGYWGIFPLWELMDPGEGKKINIATTVGVPLDIQAKTAADSVYIDDKSQLALDLDSLVNTRPGSDGQTNTGQEQQPDADGIAKQEKSLAALCSEKYIPGGIIARELNKYGMYIDSKISRKDGLYVREFERNKKSWQAELKRGLSLYDPVGKTSYDKLYSLIVFNKKLGDFYENDNLKNPGSIKAINRYRERVLQFRSFEEGELWLLDMAYELWSKGEMQ